ncbi:MAG: DUF3365 domain-containing protein [Bacteroidetes bacterium]|nr:DUF3365 domain-containing protein [Bacteroidota bacterium]
MKTKATILLVYFSALFFSCNNSTTKEESSINDSTSHVSAVVSPDIDVDFLAEGKRISTEAQAALAGNLLNAIQKGGSAFAVEFCNTKAISLTDSLANNFNANIRRVSDKPRNAVNQANENELAFMQLVSSKLKESEIPEAKLSEINGKMVGYYPIVMKDMCLQCHGQKDANINAETFEKIQKLYPTDKAIGYQANELRGLWVVEMNKK